MRSPNLAKVQKMAHRQLLSFIRMKAKASSGFGNGRSNELIRGVFDVGILTRITLSWSIVTFWCWWKFNSVAWFSNFCDGSAMTALELSYFLLKQRNKKHKLLRMERKTNFNSAKRAIAEKKNSTSFYHNSSTHCNRSFSAFSHPSFSFFHLLSFSSHIFSLSSSTFTLSFSPFTFCSRTLSLSSHTSLSLRRSFLSLNHSILSSRHNFLSMACSSSISSCTDLLDSTVRTYNRRKPSRKRRREEWLGRERGSKPYEYQSL